MLFRSSEASSRRLQVDPVRLHGFDEAPDNQLNP